MRPTNLVMIMADEHNPKMLGCAGHPLVQTPNIDALAARGTRFTSAYTNSPICVPARASFATGRHVHETGYWDNAIAYDGRIPGWGHRLQAAGRPVLSIGKLHYRSAEDPTGLDEQVIPMHIADGVGDLHGAIRPDVPPRYQSRAYAVEIGPGDTPYIGYDRDIAARAARWIAERAADGASGDTPWVLFVSFICPHFPLIVPPEYYERYPLASIPARKAPDESLFAEHPWWRAFNGCYLFDRYFADEEQRRRAIASYLGLCSFVDENVGTVVRAIEEAGLGDTTRVAYFSDHGDNMGARDLWGKSTMYEESAGVPMILAGPDVAEAKIVNTPVSLVDFHPTILQCAGVAAHADDASLPGTSLLEIGAGSDDEQRTVLSEYHAAAATSGSFMLRKGRYKYVHYTFYAPELYDLDADPEELRNLAKEPDHADLLAAFESELRGALSPEVVDARAKLDQAMLVEQHGGRAALLARGGISGTPVPGEESVYFS